MRQTIPYSVLSSHALFALHSSIVIHVNLFVFPCQLLPQPNGHEMCTKGGWVKSYWRYVWAVSSQKKTCLTSLGPKLALHLGHLRCWLFKIFCTQGLQNKWKHFVMTTCRAKRKINFNMKWRTKEKTRTEICEHVVVLRKKKISSRTWKYKIQSWGINTRYNLLNQA